MGENPQATEADLAIFRTGFKLLGVVLENRVQSRALKSRNESLLKEVNQEKSLVRTILDTMPVGVWVMDRKGAILTCNSSAEKIWAGVRYVGVDQYGEFKASWSDTGKRDPT